MFTRVERAITHTARLVLDVREWSGTVFAAGPDLEVPKPGGGTEFVRAVVRPDRPLTVTATPTSSPDPRWPFAGPVELITNRTPAGVLAFFGRVRSPGGGPRRRLLLEGTRCDLRVEGAGYRPTLLPGIRVPARADPPEVREVFVYPTGELPDAAVGPTVLTGLVTNPDGTGRPGVRVTSDLPGLTPAEVDENGVWVLELDPPGRPRHSAPGTTALVFRDPSGVELHKDPAFRFLPRRLNRYPRTTLFGRVQTADARPVRGAVVRVDLFAGETKTRPDGTWLFAAGLGEPTSGERDAVVEVTPPGPAPVKVTKAVKLKDGQANEVPPITV